MHGGVLLLKSNTPRWVFSRTLICTNGTKLHKACHIEFLLVIMKFPLLCGEWKLLKHEGKLLLT